MNTPKNAAVRKSTSTRLRPHICSAMIVAAGLTTQVYGTTVTFQNGIGGYTGYKTATLVQTAPGTVQATGLFTVDGGSGAFNDGQFRHGLFMFDNLFNNDAGPIPIGATINSASMVANFNDNSSTAFSLHRMILTWDPTTATWNSFTAGVQNDGTEAAVAATHTFSSPNGNAVGTYNPYGGTLATDIAAFATGGTVNNGWVVLPTSGTSGWGHSAAVASSAILTIDYTFGVVKNLVWNTHPTGTWDSGVGANLAWLNGGPTDFFTNGDNASFSQNASPTTVTVAAGGVSPNSFAISNASGEYTFTGAGITGPLAKSGAGSVVFSNTGNSLGAATVSGGSATFDNATTFASLAASGGSTVVLKAANTNAGGTTISGGASVETQIAGALGAGTIALNGGTLKATTAAAQTHANAWSINATNGGIIDVAGGTTLTLSTNVSATTGVLTKNGTGTLIVNGAFGSNYTGSSLVINDGTIRVAGTGNSLASATIIDLVSATSVFDDSPGDGENMGGFTGLGTFIEKDSPTAAPLFLSNGVNLSFSFAGKITGGSGGVIGTSPVGDDRRFNLTKGGTGTITLSGGTSDFAGQTIIQGGTLSISTLTARGVASSIGFGTTHTTPGTQVSAPGSTDIVIGSAAVATTFEYTGGNTSSNRAIALASTGAVAIGVTNAAAKLTLTGVISSTATPASFTKTGPGTLELTNANTYLGPTIVADGTLLANNTTGSATDGGNVTVGVAGTLGGTGTVTGSVTVDGMLAPGASIESLATGTVALQTGSTLVYEASPVDANFADLLDITGNLNLSGTVTLNLAGANLADPAWGATTISIASYTGTWNGGTFDTWLDDTAQPFGGNSWTINYNDTVAGINFTSEQPLPGTQNFVTLTQTVPEPSALLSLLGGSALLLARRRRS